MGISPISCNCRKVCNDVPNEFEFNKGDHLRSKSGNIKIQKEIETNSKSKIISSLFKSDNFESYNTPRNINVINDDIKEKAPPEIHQYSDVKNDLDIKNEEMKYLNAFVGKNKNNLKNQEINDNIKEENNYENKKINNIKNDWQMIDIKYIPNFDKTYFFSKKLKNAEKNFRKPINYSQDYQKYFKEDEDNLDILILINTMNNNKGTDHTKDDGMVFEYKGEKFLYIGDIDKDLLPTGFGILYTQGQKYEGNFFRGKLIGLGRYINDEGKCFEGIFEDNKLVTKATIITINDNNKRVEYFGDVSNWKKNGRGEEICEGEYIYNGDFWNDIKQGQGKLEYFENGEKYEGQFDKGEITGKGIYIWSNGEKYEGDFVNGIKHGKGIYIWPDGCRYEGEYNNGIREGKGKYIWEDGKIFKGMFKNGKPDGKGKIYYKGKSLLCEYKNGIPITDLSKLFKNS